MSRSSVKAGSDAVAGDTEVSVRELAQTFLCTGGLSGLFLSDRYGIIEHMFEAVEPVEVPDEAYLDELCWQPSDAEIEALIAADTNRPGAPVVACDDDVAYLDDRLLVSVAAHEELTPTMLARLAAVDLTRLDDDAKLNYTVACQRARNLFDGPAGRRGARVRGGDADRPGDLRGAARGR